MSNPNKDAVDLTNLIKDKFAMRKDIAPVETSATASQAYKVGDKFYYENLLQEATQDIAQGGTLTLNTNYKNADPVTTSIQNLSTVISKNGAKNFVALNRSPYYPQMLMNASISNQSEDSVMLTSNGVSYGCLRLYYALAPGQYIVSYDFESTDTSYSPAVTIYYAGGNQIVVGGSSIRKNEERTITIDDSHDAIDIRLFISLNDTDVRTGTFKNLMIRLASDPDGTFEPWAMTNRQLTTDKVGMDLLSEVGAVNYLNNRAVTAVENGITWTVYDDKSMNANGTQNAPGNSVFELGYQSLKKGTYRLTGCPEDGGYNTSIQLYLPNDQYAVDYGDGAVFTLNEDASCRCNIWVKHNASFSNKVFKPMIAPVSYNGPYVPYAKSNRELTEDVTDIPYVALTDNGSSEYTLSEGAMWQTKGVTFLYVAVQCNTVSPSSGGNHIKISEIPSKFKKPPLILYPAIAPYRDATTGAGTQLQIATNGQIAIRGGEVGGRYSGLFSY